MKVVNNMNSILEAIGNTPLFEFDAYSYAKMEFLNPTGSIKDRIALRMIQDAIKNNELKEGMEILEATSGNTGIALSMVGKILGYPVTIVMPENMSKERQQMIQAYGGKLVLTPAHLSIEGAVNKVKELYDASKHYLPSQFSNPSNMLAQQETAKEALKQIGKPVDIFISGIGSGGTLQGMANILKEANPNCKIIAIEPEGCSSLKHQPAKPHAIQGIGDGFIPDILDPNIVDEMIEVSDEIAIKHTQELAIKYGLFCGVSSGANYYGLKLMREKYGKEKVILTLLPDRGERYLSEHVF